jgi:hypothetical protein
MKNRIIASLLLLHPFVVCVVFLKFDLEFSWFLEKNYRFFDLLYSVISFTVFSLGIWLLASKARVYIILIFWVIFVFYQTGVWGFSSIRYLSKAEANSGVYLALIPYDIGAFSSDNFVKLELFEKKFMFFMVRRNLRQFFNVKNGDVNFSGDLITVDITYYDNKKKFESIRLNDFE